MDRIPRVAYPYLFIFPLKAILKPIFFNSFNVRLDIFYANTSTLIRMGKRLNEVGNEDMQVNPLVLMASYNGLKENLSNIALEVYDSYRVPIGIFLYSLLI